MLELVGVPVSWWCDSHLFLYPLILEDHLATRLAVREIAEHDFSDSTPPGYDGNLLTRCNWSLKRHANFHFHSIIHGLPHLPTLTVTTLPRATHGRVEPPRAEECCAALKLMRLPAVLFSRLPRER